MANSVPIRLLLVDDHEVVRLGLRTLLRREPNVEVVGEAGTAVGAVEDCLRLNPDVVLMDVRLPDGTGIEACREIRSTCPATRVIFLTSFADEDAVFATIAAGADGYLLKEIDGAGLLRAIRSVAQGQSILDPAVTERVLAQLRPLTTQGEASQQVPLSRQEQRVLGLVADGRTNKEIASSLKLSDKTIKNYLGTIFQKLHVTRRSQAAAFFARQVRR